MTRSLSTIAREIAQDWTRPYFGAVPYLNAMRSLDSIHDDYIHDFVFDDGRIQNIYLLDKKNLARNKVQVIRQFEQTGSHANRYDVTILVNGKEVNKATGTNLSEGFIGLQVEGGAFEVKRCTLEPL
jgi:hypothetical protein